VIGVPPVEAIVSTVVDDSGKTIRIDENRRVASIRVQEAGRVGRPA